MAQFKEGDICKIADIGKESQWFSIKKKFIGKRVKFLEYRTGNKEQHGEFIACRTVILDKNDMNYPWYFGQVKLEKLEQ